MDWSKIVLCGNCGSGNPCDATSCISCGKAITLQRENNANKDQVKDLIDHPPRCLNDFNVKGKKACETQLNIYFSLACSCGNKCFSVSGLPSQTENDCMVAVLLQCPDCKKEIQLFDISQQGYDAELTESNLNCRIF